MKTIRVRGYFYRELSHRYVFNLLYCNSDEKCFLSFLSCAPEYFMKQLNAFRMPLVTSLDIIDRVHLRMERTRNEGSPNICLIIHAPPNKLSSETGNNFFLFFFPFSPLVRFLTRNGYTWPTRCVSLRAGMGDRRHTLASCQVEKRSPFRYFEMRGKKNPRWELRGMFVGVRGKKWARAPYEDNSPFVRVFDNTERIGVDGDSPATLGNSIS